MRLSILLVSTSFLGLAAAGGQASETRELDAHVHGVGTLDIAVEGDAIVMAFEAPGADIVGFEHPPESDADKAAIEAALETLGDPLAHFRFSQAAGCRMTAAQVVLVGLEDDHEDHHGDDHEDHHESHHGEDHHEHDHEDAHDDDHGHAHEDHAHDGHAHDDHAHDDHAHDDHAHGEAHDHDAEHDHAHETEGGHHTEFSAEYELTCTNVQAIDGMEFPYFAAFANAKELDIRIVTDQGAKAFEVERDAPKLDLRGLF